jgi:hypothetical protein
MSGWYLLGRKVWEAGLDSSKPLRMRAHAIRSYEHVIIKVDSSISEHLDPNEIRVCEGVETWHVHRKNLSVVQKKNLGDVSC